MLRNCEEAVSSKHGRACILRTLASQFPTKEIFRESKCMNLKKFEEITSHSLFDTGTVTIAQPVFMKNNFT